MKVRLLFLLSALVVAGNAFCAEVPKLDAETEQHLDKIITSISKNIADSAREGDWEEVMEMIVQGKDVNAKDEHGYNALHYACIEGKTYIVKALLRNRANVKLKSRYGDTALHHACDIRDLDIIKLLIEEGKANINSFGEGGATPLHRACRKYQDWGKAKNLGGGYPNIPTYDIDPSVIHYLVHVRRANPLIKNEYGETPLMVLEKDYLNCKLYSKLPGAKATKAKLFLLEAEAEQIKERGWLLISHL